MLTFHAFAIKTRLILLLLFIPPLVHAVDVGNESIRELVVTVTVNEVAYAQPAVIIADEFGGLYASQQSFDLWRIDSSNLPTLEFEGASYIKLPLQTGSNPVFEESSQKLSFNVIASRLSVSDLGSRTSSGLKAIRSGNGAFLNYDFSTSQFSGGGSNSGFIEGGLFTQYGVGTSNHFISRSDFGNTTVRLDSTWEIDLPESLAAVRVGDSVTRSAPWSLGNRFGGIQYATNFRSQPFLSTSPQRGATGIATSPSTVEVYVNNVLQSRQTVAPGPFSIDNIPTTTGVGDVRVVVRDITGQEQVLTQNFYQGQGLLRQGQSDFSYELGSFRRNFGRVNSDYGDAIASATHRYGFSNELTAGYHAEMAAGNSAFGGGVVYALSDLGSVNMDMAASNSAFGNGELMLLGFERTTRLTSFGLLTQLASSDFAVLSESGSQRLAERTYVARVSQAFENTGTLSAVISSAKAPTGDSRNATISFGTVLFNRALVSLAYSRSISQVAQNILFLSTFISFDEGRTLSSLVNKRSKEDIQVSNQFRKNLPFGLGTGYALDVSSQQFYQAEVSHNSSVGTYSASVGTSRGQEFQAVSASGGVASVGGGVYFSRRISDAFGVVRVKDFPDLTVFSENIPIGKTNNSGEFLVPTLRAYQENKISINPDELPFEIEVQTADLAAVPYYRSGVLLEFPLKKIRALTFEALTGEGDPVPAGAQLYDDLGHMIGESVGNLGVVYISEFQSTKWLEAKWKGGTCKVTIGDLDDRFKNESLIDLGVLKCEAVY